jgi:hypothetical protein
MTFAHDHYVPVLKVKRGEKRALQLIAPRLRARITPLLEIVEWRKDRKPTLAAHLETAFKGLAESVRTYPGCFLEARELAPDGARAAGEVFRTAAAAGIHFVPVTGLARDTDLAAALSHRQRGLAIRLAREDFESGGLTDRLRDFAGRHDIAHQTTDLIVDLGPVDEMIVEGVAAFATQFLRAIPDPAAWRTLTLSGSAFPLSMGVVERRSHAFVERAEWLAWRSHVRPDDGLPRVPTYSDCAIQHPSGVEGFDPRRMQVSAAVRYALPEKWLLIKGESTRRRLPSEQFPELATQLAYGHLRQHFAGERHCEGCRSIKAAADQRAGFGRPEDWRRIGTVHHITQVMESLGGPSAS